MLLRLWLLVGSKGPTDRQTMSLIELSWTAKKLFFTILTCTQSTCWSIGKRSTTHLPALKTEMVLFHYDEPLFFSQTGGSTQKDLQWTNVLTKYIKAHSPWKIIPRGNLIAATTSLNYLQELRLPEQKFYSSKEMVKEFFLINLASMLWLINIFLQ